MKIKPFSILFVLKFVLILSFSLFPTQEIAYANYIPLPPDDGVIVPPEKPEQTIAEKELVLRIGDFNEIWRPFITFFLSATLLTVVLAFIVNTVKLAKSAGNPSGRTEAINNLVVLLVISAILGGFSFFFIFGFTLFS